MTLPVAAAALALCAGLVLLFRTRRARLIAALSLLPLPIVAGVLLALGQRSHGESATTESTESKVGVFGAVEQTARKKAEPAAKKSDASADLLGLLAPAKALPGLTWPDAPEEYTPDTLWNRIDGGAEAYKQRGLKKAVFATARLGEAEIEVQLYDLGTSKNAEAQYADATAGGQSAKLEGVGDAAELWDGGGDLRRGSVFIHVMVTVPTDAPDVTAAPARLLMALAGVPPTAERPPPTPATAEPAVRPATPEEAQVLAALGTPEAVEVRLDGWGGRAYLGRVVAATWKDGMQAFVAEPRDPDDAVKQLAASFGGAAPDPRDGVAKASDPYVGDVLFGRRGARLIGVAAYADEANTRLTLVKLLAASPRGP